MRQHSLPSTNTHHDAPRLSNNPLHHARKAGCCIPQWLQISSSFVQLFRDNKQQQASDMSAVFFDTKDTAADEKNQRAFLST
mmetsp:Transcript_19890/g.33884  ORF Transcript_19890/g.33884 Transcript_19890/m.33884 type:complete len:82 (-) Transcript_19890:2981-3226(-)